MKIGSAACRLWGTLYLMRPFSSSVRLFLHTMGGAPEILYLNRLSWTIPLSFKMQSQRTPRTGKTQCLQNYVRSYNVKTEERLYMRGLILCGALWQHKKIKYCKFDKTPPLVYKTCYILQSIFINITFDLYLLINVIKGGANSHPFTDGKLSLGEAVHHSKSPSHYLAGRSEPSFWFLVSSFLHFTFPAHSF